MTTVRPIRPPKHIPVNGRRIRFRFAQQFAWAMQWRSA